MPSRQPATSSTSSRPGLRFGRRSTGPTAPNGSGRTTITSRRDLLVALIADPRPYLGHEDPAIRRLAIAVSGEAHRGLALDDPDPAVRAAAVEAGAGLEILREAAADDADDVREAVATVYGEIADEGAVEWLIDRALHDSDQLVREAAVAALGAIEDDRALPVLLDLIADAPPRVRRRAVVALTVFDDPAIEAAIRAATRDRNPGVREAAEMVVGRSAD
jgi:HEAT repeat protein